MKSNFRVMAAVLLIIASGLIVENARADILVLKNGDRITGAIKRIWDGEVSIEPEYADEFAVDLAVIDHIVSDRDFELEFEDGSEVVARFPGVDADNQQLISVDEESAPIALADILELDEPAKAFDWESHIDFSATLNSGNTNTASGQLRADSQIEIPNHRHLLELSKFNEESNDITTKDLTLLKYSYNWLFRDPWFFAANASHERDPIIELDSRLIVSAGMGRDIFNTPRRLLSIQLGAGAQKEDIGGSSENSTVGVWALRYRQNVLSDDMEIFHNHTITYNFGGRTNTSYKTSTGLRFEITDLLYANMTLNYNYETEPADTRKNEDVAVLLGLGAEF
jgi:putative salt-induced outer membrane protein YdiY